MSIPCSQLEVAHFLQGCSGSAPKETHISAIFIGKDTVWKLKKAVRLPFVDFSTLEARHRFLERELQLNRPVAPGIYRDLAAVVRRQDGVLALTADPGGQAPLEWVLRMARVSDRDFLDAMAARGELTPELLDALGDCVAAYHAGLAPVRHWDSAGALREVARGNGVSARAARLAESLVGEWLGRIEAEWEMQREWLADRAKSGLVRRAHGDLHLGNLCLWDGAPVPFDALEFDEALATIDLGYDLAFLLMDLDLNVARAAANRVLNRYVARNGDDALTRGLPLFLSLRAMVRAHVRAASGQRQDGERHLQAARDYLHPHPKLVLAIGGLPGTGKSTLARALAPELGAAPGALILRSDEIRKRMWGIGPEQRLPEAAYTRRVNAQVYETLTGSAADVAAGGHAVIADAAFLELEQRLAIAAAAERADARFVGIWLHAPLAVLEARIAARRCDASDATVGVLHRAAATAIGHLEWEEIDTRDTEAALRKVQRQRL